jgi:hypothetical protein
MLVSADDANETYLPWLTRYVGMSTSFSLGYVSLVSIDASNGGDPYLNRPDLLACSKRSIDCPSTSILTAVLLPSSMKPRTPTSTTSVTKLAPSTFF